MTFTVLRSLFCAAGLFGCVMVVNPAFSQAPEQKPAEQAKPGQPDPAKEAVRKLDEFADAAKQLDGPAGQPECVWLGRRVVNLLWRDDLDTAFRHLDLYDRFGCPGGHIQVTFRCVVRQGNIDPKAPESLATRVHACWVNPGLQTSGANPSSTGANPGTNVQ